MKGIERRKLDRFERQAAFMTDNAADFPKGTPGEKAAKVNADIVAEMLALAGSQLSDDNQTRQAVDDKDDLLEDLFSLLKNISRAANAFDDDVPGTDEMFRMPRNRAESILLATARAFQADAAPLETQFVEYGLPADFLTTLAGYITAIEAANTRADTGEEQRGAATAGLLDAAQRGTANSRKLDSVVRIRYTGNPQKLAAWTIASHLERAPKKPKPPTPKPPTP